MARSSILSLSQFPKILPAFATKRITRAKRDHRLKGSSSRTGRRRRCHFARRCPCIEPENRRVCGLPLLSQQSQKDRLKRCAHPLAGSSSPPPPPPSPPVGSKRTRLLIPFDDRTKRRKKKKKRKRVTEAWSRNFTISKGNTCLLTSLTDHRLRCLFFIGKISLPAIGRR